MPRSICFLIIILLAAIPVCAQNMQLLYGFDQLPQTLLLNPGARVDYEKHLGIPFLSNLYLQAGASNPDLNYNSVWLNADGGSDILRNIYAVDPDDGDLFKIDQQMEILYAGIRLKDPRLYLSFGMYQQFRGFARYPKGLADLYFMGNDQNGDGVPEREDAFSISGLIFLGDLTGVFHLGLNMEVSQDLIVGGRIKLYSGSLSIESGSNSGIYSLAGGFPGYNHQFDAMDLAILSSGFIKPDGSKDLGSPPEILSGLFFLQGNAGFGMDLGFTYFASDVITITGSVLDLGFLNYSNKVTGYEIEQDFEIFDTTYFDPPAGNEPRYWEDLWTGYYDEGKLDQVLDTLTSGYLHPRSVKLNATVHYELGKKSRKSRSVYRNVSCDPDLTRNGAAHAAGLQLFTEFQPGHPLWAVTAFYSREFTRQIHAKFTYTADEFSATNLGMGLSLHFGAFNFYMAADNLLALPSIRESNYQSFQIGMNLIY